MRFMMLMLPDRAYDSGPPDVEAFKAMGRYNEELLQAGVLLALDGLRAPSEGARVSFKRGTPTVTDGPFAEAKEVVGGYWLIQAKSLAEAVEWASRCPVTDNATIEVRPVYDFADFPPEVREALGGHSKIREALGQP